MTRNEFINTLRDELKNNNINEIEDIIAEYQEHFDFKLEEGKTEEEIASKFSAPKDIAKEYTPAPVTVNKFEKGVKATGLTFMSIPAAMIYVVMWGAVAVLGAFAICCLVAGFCLITTINIAGLIPSVPYLPALIMGFALFGLSILSATGTIYMFLYLKQWGKCYLRWCKNISNKNIYPALSKHPKVSKKFSYRLKLLSIIGLVLFVSAFLVGYFVMCLYAGNMEPWHVWNWFV